MCRACAFIEGGKKNTFDYDFVKQYIESEGCKLISREYVGVFDELDIIARCNHATVTTLQRFKNLGNNRYCPECTQMIANENQAHSYDYVKRYFEDESCILLTRFYENNRHKLDYIARSGHKHDVTFNEFGQGGNRLCPPCAFEQLRGENHPNWNPDLNEGDRVNRRDSHKIDEWRTKVFSRDDYCCVKCHKRSQGDIVAHHINGYHWHNDGRYEVDNGATLCEQCHKAFHSTYGVKYNTSDQFD